MRSYLEKHRLLYGHIGAIIALIIAVIYLVVIPGEVLEASGMQKLATKVFIAASIAFGVLGILVILTATGPNTPDSLLNETLIKLLGITVFIMLPSFALSIAGKYLKSKS